MAPSTHSVALVERVSRPGTSVEVGDALVAVNGESVRHLAFNELVEKVRRDELLATPPHPHVSPLTRLRQVYSGTHPLTLEFYRLPGEAERVAQAAEAHAQELARAAERDAAKPRSRPASPRVPVSPSGSVPLLTPTARVESHVMDWSADSPTGGSEVSCPCLCLCLPAVCLALSVCLALCAPFFTSRRLVYPPASAEFR